MIEMSVAHQFFLDVMDDVEHDVVDRIQAAANLLQHQWSIDNAVDFLKNVVRDSSLDLYTRNHAATVLAGFERPVLRRAVAYV